MGHEWIITQLWSRVNHRQTVAKFPEGKPSNVASTLLQEARADIGGRVPAPRLRPFGHSQEWSLVRTVSCQIREVGP